jgi:hypothetical protein
MDEIGAAVGMTRQGLTPTRDVTTFWGPKCSDIPCGCQAPTLWPRLQGSLPRQRNHLDHDSGGANEDGREYIPTV